MTTEVAPCKHCKKNRCAKPYKDLCTKLKFSMYESKKLYMLRNNEQEGCWAKGDIDYICGVLKSALDYDKTDKLDITIERLCEK